MPVRPRPGEAATAPSPSRSVWAWVRRNKTIVGGAFILLALVVVAILAPWLAGDPLAFEPTVQGYEPNPTGSESFYSVWLTGE